MVSSCVIEHDFLHTMIHVDVELPVGNCSTTIARLGIAQNQDQEPMIHRIQIPTFDRFHKSRCFAREDPSNIHEIRRKSTISIS